ncbi:olfactory receptor 1468-like [Rhinoderma darwinii]|uniref:olfactory receptor 1468-like n=1 Tax=Rhinoderma darwinii TaxID=43563 RepID=UPI003F677769
MTLASVQQQMPDYSGEGQQEKNQSVTTEFFLLGFQVSQRYMHFLFCLLLMAYFITLCGNFLIITLVSVSKNLHTPMYFFLTQLSISDILLTTNIVPIMLRILLNNGGTITFKDCITQLYFFCATEALECFLLTVMSYDRYVAICNPLRYTSIMTRSHCETLTIICWLFSFSITLSDTIAILMLMFCGSNIIDHFFCDLVPLLEISCSDTFVVQLEVYLIGIPVVLIPSIIIVISYIKIIATILKISSRTGRHKTFSTCGSHLTVVCIFYWTMFCVYVFPTKVETFNVSKILSLLYTVCTPLINPMIYSFKNKDIRNALEIKMNRKIYF